MKKIYLQPATETLLVLTESDMLTESKTMGVIGEVTATEEDQILSREFLLDGTDILK
jgi:hypothetical protein